MKKKGSGKRDAAGGKNLKKAGSKKSAMGSYS